MLIYIILPTEEIFTFEIDPQKTINDLKSLITTKTKYNIKDIDLLFNNIILNNDQTIANSGIKDSELLSAKIQKRISLSIRSNFLNKTYPLDIESNKLVYDLKHEFLKLLNPDLTKKQSIEDIRLEISGNELQNWKTINSIPNVLMYIHPDEYSKEKFSIDDITVLIKPIAESIQTFRIDKYKTVYDLKVLLVETFRQKYPYRKEDPEDITIIFGGVKLKDDSILKDIENLNGNLAYQGYPPSIEINITAHNQKVYPIKTYGYKTVYDLKVEFAKEINEKNINKIVLVIDNKILENDQKVRTIKGDVFQKLDETEFIKGKFFEFEIIKRDTDGSSVLKKLELEDLIKNIVSDGETVCVQNTKYVMESRYQEILRKNNIVFANEYKNNVFEFMKNYVQQLVNTTNLKSLNELLWGCVMFKLMERDARKKFKTNNDIYQIGKIEEIFRNWNGYNQISLEYDNLDHMEDAMLSYKSYDSIKYIHLF